MSTISALSGSASAARHSSPLFVLGLGLLAACNTGSGKETGSSASSDGSDGSDCYAGSADGSVDPSVFPAAGLTGDITEEACTLTNGSTTTCLRIPLQGRPTDHEVGPFCPRTVDATADEVGIWLDEGTSHAVDGAFIVGLADFYGDDAWQLYDTETGVVRVTETLEACEAAARPDVDPAYQNHCVECSLDDLGGGVATVLLVPKVPVAAARPLELGDVAEVGAALTGVGMAPPAPLDAILGAYTIAPFDDCGGHVNPVDGYHLHTPVGCGESPASCDDHGRLLGVALDGHAILATSGDNGVEPDDLDECRGHEDAVRGYHYHAASPGENLFIGCFHGEVVDSGTGGGDGGGPGDDGGPGDEVIDCLDVAEGTPCCGDAVCDGPETEASCPADCG